MKNIINILLVLFLFTATKANGQQWQKYADLPPNAYPIDVATNNQGHIFLLCKKSQIYWKAPGANWKKMQRPAIIGDLIQAPCISVDKNANKLYMGSLFNGMYYTSDSGNTWNNTFLTTSPISGDHEGYLSIATTNNPNLIFAAASDVVGAIAKFTNQGATGQFITYSPDINEGAETVHYTKNQNLLIGTNDGIWLSANNGTTITETSFNQERIIKFTEDTSGRVYALTLNKNTGIMSLIYSDNYQNWNALSLPNTTEEYTTVFYENTTNALWIGSRNNIYKTSIDTIAWQAVNFNNVNPSVVEITATNNGRILCLSTQNILQELDPVANNWNNLANNIPGEANQISMTKDGKILVADHISSNIVSALISPTNNWNNEALDDLPGIKKIAVSNNGKVFCISVRNIYRSNDSAATFQATNLPTDISGLPGLGNTNMYVGEQNGLFLTRPSSSFETKVWGSFDGGNTWPFIKDFGNILQILNFAQDRSGNMYALILNTNFDKEIQYSINGGITWNILPDNNNVVNSFLYEPQLQAINNRIFLVGAGEALYEINTTATNPFIQIPLPTNPVTAGEPFYGLHIDNFNKLHVCYNHIYQSADTGQTWQQIPFSGGFINAQNKLNGFYVSADGTPYILVQNSDGNNSSSVCWYTNNPLSTGNIRGQEVAVTVYPNPITDVLNYSIKNTNRNNVILSISNLQGQLLEKNDITQYEKGWLNFHEFSSGIYFVEFKSAEFSKTFKIVKQ